MSNFKVLVQNEDGTISPLEEGCVAGAAICLYGSKTIEPITLFDESETDGASKNEVLAITLPASELTGATHAIFEIYTFTSAITPADTAWWVLSKITAGTHENASRVQGAAPNTDRRISIVTLPISGVSFSWERGASVITEAEQIKAQAVIKLIGWERQCE